MNKIGFAGLVVLLLLALGSSGSAFNPNVAVDGQISRANLNPAGLMGLTTPEFGLQLRIVPQASEEEPYSRQYHLLYAEPDYGTGAGLLHFIYSDSLRQITYVVADQILDPVNAGVSLKYISHPKNESKYVSTDLGLQIGVSPLMRIGVTAENFWHLKFGDTEAALPTNIILGAALELGEFGVVALDVNDVLNTNAARKLMLGVEIKPVQSLALRAGWNEGWTVGAGFAYRQMQLGYDWAQGQHHLSFSWQF
mgnify:CR=1 FL=1